MDLNSHLSLIWLAAAEISAQFLQLLTLSFCVGPPVITSIYISFRSLPRIYSYFLKQIFVLNLWDTFPSKISPIICLFLCEPLNLSPGTLNQWGCIFLLPKYMEIKECTLAKSHRLANITHFIWYFKSRVPSSFCLLLVTSESSFVFYFSRFIFVTSGRVSLINLLHH